MDVDRKQLAQNILDQMLDGNGLRASCRSVGLPMSTFLRWVSEDEKLADQYAHARAILLEHLSEDLIDKADEAVGVTNSGATDAGAVAKQKLQVDTRKWLLSKLALKKYGDRITQELTGANGGPILTKDVSDLSDAELAAIANGDKG